MNALTPVETAQNRLANRRQQMPVIVPATMEEAFRMSQAVMQSGLAPRGFDNPQSLMIAIMHGMEVGMAPMQALQNIGVINGKAALYGDGLPALVRSSGLCKYIKEWFEGEGDQRTAWCESHRVGEPEPVKAWFSVADAKRAKLWMKKGRNGADTPWVQYPERMLKMRARAFCLRDAYADVLSGLGVYEEVRDYIDIAPSNEDAGSDERKALTPPPIETSKKATTKKTSAKKAETEEPAPPPPPPPPPPAETQPDDAPQAAANFDQSPDDVLTELDNICTSLVEGQDDELAQIEDEYVNAPHPAFDFPGDLSRAKNIIDATRERISA